MKLILENWRRYLTEGEAEQFPWLKELKDAATFKEQGEVLENKDLFEFVARGNFRKVYQPIEDEDYVVKIALPHHEPPHRMNEDDFKLSIEYPLIFPKAYAHSDDFSWVVLEKVGVISYKEADEEAMQKILDKSFPAEQKAIKEEVPQRGSLPKVPGGDVRWPEAIWNPKVGSDDLRSPTVIMELIMASYRFGHLEDVGEKEMQDLISPIAGGVYDELSKAMAEYSIDPREIRPGNIGYDKDYNFKIIDSSVFGKQT